MSRSHGLMATLKDKDKKSAAVSSSSSLGSNGVHNNSNNTLSLTHHSHTFGGLSSSKTFPATVVFLDDSTHVFEVDKKAKGSTLLELVMNHLELNEREYFGLLFNDTGGTMPVNAGLVSSAGASPSDVMRWLDPVKPLRKQLRGFSSSPSTLASGTGSLLKVGGGAALVNTPVLYFRVKFYVTDPSRLIEEFTRYHLYLQVKRDLLEGRLRAPVSTLCLLTSYAVQSTLGDYEPDVTSTAPTASYLAPFSDLRKKCLAAASLEQQQVGLTPEEVDRRIIELHKLHRGQSPAEAEFNFLEHAKRLEMYGISLHNGKDSSGRDIQLGVTSIGLVVFQNFVKINTFSWSKIVKISFKRKQFFIQLRKELTESYDTLLGFNLASYRSCKNLWKSAVEHHSFFRLHSPKPPPKRFLLTLGSKFRYSGRTELQAVATTGSKRLGASSTDIHGRSQGQTTATMTSMSKTKSLNRATPSRKTLPLTLESSGTTTNTSRPGSGEKRAPRLASPETSSIGSSIHSNGALKSLSKPSAPSLATILNDSHAGSAVSSRKDLQNVGVSGSPAATSTNSTSSLAHRALESFNNKVQSLSTKLPKKAWQEETTSDDEGGFLDPSRRISSLGRLSSIKGSPNPSINAPTHSVPPTNAPVPTSTPFATSSPKPLLPSSIPLPTSLRLPFADETSSSGKSVASNSSGAPTVGVTPTAPLQPPGAGVPSELTSVASGGSLSNGNSSTLQLRSEAVESASPSGLANAGCNTMSGLNTEEINGGLVVITILPDEKGRFGFNVKGGADQKMPIIVSRVGANTPADKCYPKLNEGDQVVLINGRDVSGHTHDQVVHFIRASSEPHSGQLILAVKQNVYLGEEVEEPEFQYVPEAPLVSPQLPGTKALSQAMLLLEESLDSGAIVGQFEQLYRRNPGLQMTICHSAENMTKNRYRDISPYDATRVVLKECPTGDYINANHVKMTIPGSGIINRYIATQGPLNPTCIDFWYMCWESQSNLIIMLTTIVERGRVKCHKYWPDVGESMDFEGGLSVKCTKEDEHDSFAFRDFEVTLKDEVRQMTQMAYLSWPDHGVPDSPDEFVDFVEQVRAHRQGSIYPTVVHCSAGIGRTGVLILMESALCLIEANQPVYPLDLTRQMRDQRASMIQTPSQYKFVCQAILKVYKEGKVKPLPEFCQRD